MARIRNPFIAALLATCLAASSAAAAQECGLCNREVVLNRELATCFLQRFPELSSRKDGPITVDLTSCEEESRGVFEALPLPEAPPLQPDTRFLVTRTQLDCLHRILQASDVEFDPAARIELAGCQ